MLRQDLLALPLHEESGPHIEYAEPIETRVIKFIKGTAQDPNFRGLVIKTKNASLRYGFTKKGKAFFIFMHKKSLSTAYRPEIKIIKMPGKLSVAMQKFYDHSPKLQTWGSKGIKFFNLAYKSFLIGSEAIHTFEKHKDLNLHPLEALYHAGFKVYCRATLFKAGVKCIGSPWMAVAMVITEMAEACPDLRDKWQSENAIIQALMATDQYKKLSLVEKQKWLTEQLRLHPFAQPSTLHADYARRILRTFSFNGMCRLYDALIFNLMGLPENPRLQANDPLILNPGDTIGLLEHIVANPPRANSSTRIDASSFRISEKDEMEIRKRAQQRFALPPTTESAYQNTNPYLDVPIDITIPMQTPNIDIPNISFNFKIDVKGIVEHLFNSLRKRKIDSDTRIQYGDSYKYHIKYDGVYTVKMTVRDDNGNTKSIEIDLKKNLGFIPTSPAHKDNQKAIKKEMKLLFKDVMSMHIGRQLIELQIDCQEAKKTPSTCVSNTLVLTSKLQRQYPAADFPQIRKLCIELITNALYVDSHQLVQTQLADIGAVAKHNDLAYRLHLPNPAKTRRGKDTIADVDFINKNWTAIIAKPIVEMNPILISNLIKHVEAKLKHWQTPINTFFHGYVGQTETTKNIEALKDFRDFLYRFHKDVVYIQDFSQIDDINNLIAHLLHLQSSDNPNPLIVEALSKHIKTKLEAMKLALRPKSSENNAQEDTLNEFNPSFIYYWEATYVYQPISRICSYGLDNYAKRWGNKRTQQLTTAIQTVQLGLPTLGIDLTYLPVGIYRRDNWLSIFKFNMHHQISQYQKYFNNPFGKWDHLIGASSVLGNATTLACVLTGRNPKVPQAIGAQLDNLVGMNLLLRYGYTELHSTDDAQKNKALKKLRKFWSPYETLKTIGNICTAFYEVYYSDPEAENDTDNTSISTLIVNRIAKLLITPNPGHLAQQHIIDYAVPDLLKLLIFCIDEMAPLATFQILKIAYDIVTGQYCETHIQYALRDAKYFLKIGDYIKGEERVSSILNALRILTYTLPAYFGYNATPAHYSENDSHTVKAAKLFIPLFYCYKYFAENNYLLIRKTTDFSKINDNWVLTENHCPLTESAPVMLLRLHAAIADPQYLLTNYTMVLRESEFLLNFYQQHLRDKANVPAVTSLLTEFANVKSVLTNFQRTDIDDQPTINSTDIQNLIRFRETNGMNATPNVSPDSLRDLTTPTR